MDSTLDDLKRRAYSSDSDDALAARQQLVELDTERHGGTDREEPSIELEEPHRFSSAYAGVVGALALATAIAATAVVSTPVSSLEVFDRAATAIDQEMEERAPMYWGNPARPDWVDELTVLRDVDIVPGSARWLGESNGYDIFGYLGDRDGQESMSFVCLSISKVRMSIPVCVTREEFESVGIQHYNKSRPVDKVVHVTVIWGPTGDARIVDRPPEEVAHR